MQGASLTYHAGYQPDIHGENTVYTKNKVVCFSFTWLFFPCCEYHKLSTMKCKFYVRDVEWGNMQLWNTFTL